MLTTDGLLLLQVPPVLPVVVRVVVVPVQIAVVPVMVPAVAEGVTVITCVAVAVPQVVVTL